MSDFDALLDSPCRLLVTGGRTFADERFAQDVLHAIHAKHRIALLIHGAARGADRICARWARRHDIPIAAYPADWTAHPDTPWQWIGQDSSGRRYNRRAGVLRNQRMIDEGHPTLCVAFSGGTGTADMVGRWTLPALVAERPHRPIYDCRDGTMPAALQGDRP